MKISQFQLKGKDVGLLLFLVSLLLPAIDGYQAESDVLTVSYGWEILLVGALTVFDGSAAWFANIAFCVAYCARSFRWAMNGAVLSIALGVSSYAYTSSWNDGDGRVAISYSYGFYVWMLSFTWVFIARFLQFKAMGPEGGFGKGRGVKLKSWRREYNL